MADSYLNISIELPENFLQELEHAILDEIKIAEKKWKTKLSQEERDYIFKNSLEQTRLKASVIARQPWDLDDKLALRIPSLENRSVTVTAEGVTPKTRGKIGLVITKAGWIIADEESINPIQVSDLFDSQIQHILAWARTAAFYGVGSYSR